MVPTKELIDQLYREEVAFARLSTPAEKVWQGLELFDSVRRRMMDGIRFEFPDADDARVQAIFVERLALARRLEAPYDLR